MQVDVGVEQTSVQDKLKLISGHNSWAGKLVSTDVGEVTIVTA